MTRSLRASFLRAAAVFAALFVLVGCSSAPSGSTQGPNPTTLGPAVTQAPAATVTGAATSGPAAGEPCSFLTAEAVGAIVGTVPLEVAERIGRGDCDYFLTAAKQSKVNIGVFTGVDAAALFDVTKGLGDPQPVSLGDEAYSIYNEGLGTLVLVRKGDSVASVQVLTPTDAADQLAKATALAQALLAGL